MNDPEFLPVTAERWDDLSEFFTQHGKTNYCWCMRWRVKSQEYKELRSAGRKKKLASFVETDIPIGVLGYQQGKPAGWCSIAPRETYALLESSTTLKRIDDVPTWSVACFFVDPKMRGQGFAVKLLKAAVAYAISQGATCIEGYPVEPDKSYRFMGSPSVFEKAGFKEAGRATNGRRIVRYIVGRG